MRIRSPSSAATRYCQKPAFSPHGRFTKQAAFPAGITRPAPPPLCRFRSRSGGDVGSAVAFLQSAIPKERKIVSPTACHDAGAVFSVHAAVNQRVLPCPRTATLSGIAPTNKRGRLLHCAPVCERLEAGIKSFFAGPDTPACRGTAAIVPGAAAPKQGLPPPGALTTGQPHIETRAS